MSFTNYIEVATSVTDDGSNGRAGWSREDVARGVVECAMEGVAGSLSSDFQLPVVEVASGVHVVAQTIVFNGCRVDVVGSSKLDELPELLLRECVDRAREALTICVLPSAAHEIVDLRGDVEGDVLTGVLAFYPRDIDALATGEVGIIDLLEYKLLRRLLTDRPDAETQFAPRLFAEYRVGTGGQKLPWRSAQEAIELRGERSDEWLRHPGAIEADALCGRGRNVLLVGYSSSGKSVLALQVGLSRASAGWSVKYANLGEAVGAPVGIVRDLLLPRDDRGGDTAGRLVVLDDLQSNPAVARVTLALASLAHRARTGPRPVVLAISWKEFAKEATRWCSDVAPLAVHAHVIRKRLVESYAEEVERSVVEAIGREIGDDIYLLRLALEVTRRERSQPSRGQVAEDVWRTRMPRQSRVGVPDGARRVAVIAGAVGQFDIHLPPEFLCSTARVDRKLVAELIDSRLLRRVGRNVTLGHRSLCALIAWWLEEAGAWDELRDLGGPQGVTETVLLYLEASGTAASVEALRALIARAGFKDRADLSARTVALMDIWRAFDAVVEQVEQQQLSDPTWGRTPSSSMFVTTLLTEIGKAKLAVPSVDFLRGHWMLEDGRLEIDTTGLATVVDFNLLHKEILREDDKRTGPEGVETGLDIDVERFHRAWLAGLIVGAEAATPEPRFPRDQLAAAVEREQISGSGAFYPHRVPWCTARVLLGLAACGRTTTTSTAVKRSVEWLLRDRSGGGAATDGIWLSGTGGWNSAVETTALVLLALIKVGVDPADARLERPREFLMSTRDQWAGFEGAVAIDALLATGSPWEELASDAARVSEWALDQSLWQRATLPADEILAQTCHVAQAATHLVEIGWTAMKSDLPALLEAVDLSEDSRVSGSDLARHLTEESGSGPTQEDTGVGVGDAAAREVRRLGDIVLSRFRVAGDYARYDERARNALRDRAGQIRAALEAKSDRRENYLLWAPPGSGKSYFVQQIAASFGSEFLETQYHELNLADLSQEAFLAKLEAVRSSTVPTLCMIDEVDGRSTEPWPYEALFAALDLNTRSDHHVVFMLVGSSGKGLNGLLQSMSERPKGKDLIDRVPSSNRFEIPPVVEEDRLIVFIKQALIAARAKGQRTREIDRLVLYYVLKRSELASPRQCAEFAKSAVSRMDASDDRLLYDHLFRNGDRERVEFYAQNVADTSSLQGLFIEVGD
jgi:hypothetical protein